MNLKNAKNAVLALFGITDFTKAEGKYVLSAEQVKELDEFKGEGFSEKFLEAINKELENSQSAEEAAALKIKLEEKEQENAQLAAANKTQKEKIAALIDMPETDATIKKEINPEGKVIEMNTKKYVASATDKFLFGTDYSFNAIDAAHPYNMRIHAALMAKQGVMIAVPAAASIDYTTLKSDLGDFYRVRAKEGIQSFLANLPDLENIFPLKSGYQDQAALVNMFMGEFSQADNSNSTFDNVVKGAYDLQPEILSMADVMFAHKFTGLKELEKTFIGDMNQEGSSSMKWGFIGYILVETGKKLKNERNIRRIKGVRKNPILNVPGKALEASDGLREFIRKQIAAFKIKPFAMGDWTESNASSYLYEFTGKIPTWFRDMGDCVIYCAPDFITKYNKNRETLYGGNTDYKADIQYVAEYPNVRLRGVPGMDESKRLIASIDKNICLFEDQAGEMFNFNIEQQDWSLKVWSQWKESVWAFLVGKKFASAAEQDYENQFIFCNDVDLGADYFIPMSADDATPSVLRHKSLVSVANAAATAITGIDDAATGDTVILKCGSATNAITIAASGNFSLLTAAWAPAVGDTLKVKKRSDGKWIELERTNALSVAVQIAADDATPDVTGANTFVTHANTTATAITTLENAVTGTVYTIHGAGTTNASTIANSGNFVLTAAMTLSAGNSIVLEKSKTNSKFYEISRVTA